MSTNLDHLSSGLASGTITRRRALAVIGTGALGALIPWVGRAEAQPGCRQEGHPCEGNQTCCPGLVCQEAAGPGQAARCVKPRQDQKCDYKKECGPKKECPKGYKCECTKRVLVKTDKKCKKGCPKGYTCKKDGYCYKRVTKYFCKKVKKYH